MKELFGDILKNSKFFEILGKRKMRILKQSHSAEKLERGDLLGFLKLVCCKISKKLKGGPFDDKKIEKVAQCRIKLKRGTL